MKTGWAQAQNDGAWHYFNRASNIAPCGAILGPRGWPREFTDEEIGTMMLFGDAFCPECLEGTK